MKIKLSQLRKIIREEVVRTLREDAQSATLSNGPVLVTGLLEKMAMTTAVPTPAMPLRGDLELFPEEERGYHEEPDAVGVIYFTDSFEDADNLAIVGDSIYITQADLDSGNIKQQKLFSMSNMSNKPNYNFN
jgi:hypothetical protein